MISGVDVDPTSLTFQCSDYDALSDRNEVEANQDAFIQQILEEDEIDAEKVLELLFPKKKADVFISHSSKDQLAAYKIARDLKEIHDLDCFVDSSVWGSVYDFLRKVDDRYCWQEASQTYNYTVRNSSTAHVYAVLTTALQRMMWSSDYFMFLRTDNSLKMSDVGDDDKTYSPWIHMELHFSSLVIPMRKSMSYDSVVANESRDLNFSHSGPTWHLKSKTPLEYDFFLRKLYSVQEFFGG